MPGPQASSSTSPVGRKASIADNNSSWPGTSISWSSYSFEDPPPPPDATVEDVGRPGKPAQPLQFDSEVVALRQAIRTPDRGWWARLREIDCPTVIIGGGPSSHVDQLRPQQVSHSIANCRFVEVDVGHSIHQAEPQRFGDLVVAALA
jgi:esterase